jgi:uroporphyrinogen III methyltransferase/synthase
LIETGSLDSAKVIVVTGNLNRDKLIKKLEAGRAIVDRLQIYKTEKTDLTDDPVADDFRQHGADAILFASSSSAESYHSQGDSLKLAAAARKPLVGSIGAQTSESLEELGMKPDFIAARPSLDALLEALIARLKR